MKPSEQSVPLQNASTGEIADWIRAQIRANRMVPGQRLVEADLIRQTGSSRFKVREALQRLAAEGLVVIEEFRGASVREASMEEIHQLYRARAALEGMCTADFVRLATPQEKQRLYDLADEIEACIDEDLSEEFGTLNNRWHRQIMQVSGNTVLAALVTRLHTPVQRLQFANFYRGDRLSSAVEDHRAIVAAIKKGDAEAAEAAMRQHIENGLRYLTAVDKAVRND